MDFTVGAVPVFKYLESQNVDEVGYTLRTASLMTDPEYFFDERNPSDYALFAIHYLIVPSGYLPPVAARLARQDGPYSLWTLSTTGYVRVGRIIGHINASRTNIGRRSIALLHSRLTQQPTNSASRSAGAPVPIRPCPRRPVRPPPARSSPRPTIWIPARWPQP